MVSVRGVHPLKANDAFPPVSDFPRFRKFSQVSPFPKQNFSFHPPKISDEIFSHSLKISNLPLFSQNSDIFPLFRKTSFSLCSLHSPCLHSVCGRIYVIFSSPYFDNDAFMHHHHAIHATGRPWSQWTLSQLLT